MSINTIRSVGVDEAFAIRWARAMARDPSLLERNAELVTEVAAYPAAREVLSSIFKARKKVAHRFQRARVSVNTAAFA